MSPHTETIYVSLLNAGSEAWRPVLAHRRAHGLFEIVSKNDDPEDEVWSFSTGCLVRCEIRMLNGEACQVAVALHAPLAPRAV